MFGGMMDPEMMRVAQEQMSRMRPEDLQRMQQQMMSNPDLLRMASEGMKNIRPEDLRMAAEHMKNIPPEQMADISSRIGSSTPEDIAAMRSQGEAYRSYEYQGALSLKTQGNQLHGIGKYSEAAEKYLRAKNNLRGNLTPEAKSLKQTCSLNLMSCYLKTKQYQDVVAEGTEVLKGESQNLKAYYRRGQAYKEMKQFKLAVSDLDKAAELSPEDETIAETLRQAREELGDEGVQEPLLTNGPLIEEVTDEEAERFSSSMREDTVDSSSNSSVVTENGEQSSTSDTRSPLPNGMPMGDGLSALAQNPEIIRGMHSMLSSMNPEHLAAMSGGGITPDMAKLTADMVKTMSPEDLERMMGMASQFQVPGGAFPQVQPPSAARRSNSEPAGVNGSVSMSPLETVSSTPNLSQRVGSNSGAGMPSMADFSPDMQEQVRKQMQDPGMKQMMASMMKSMTPETMASMSEQLGMKLSPEEAAKAQQAMANLSPDDLDRIMKWADRAQRVAQQAKQAKDWLLGKPGLILALVMLILAVILHRLGYIG